MREEYINWLEENKKFFNDEDIPTINMYLNEMEPEHFAILSEMSLKKPSIAVLLAIIGIERFYLGDALLGFLKIITNGGFYIWIIIDIFTASKRAKSYNMKKAMEIINLTVAQASPQNLQFDTQQKKAILDGAKQLGKVAVKSAKTIQNTMDLDY